MKEFRDIPVYRQLVLSGLLNGIGNSLFNIVFVVYASTLPFKELAVTLASMAIFIPNVSQLFLGYQADRTLRKTRGTIIAKLAQAGLFFCLSLLITLPASLPLFIGLLLINVLADCLGIYSGGVMLPIIKKVIPVGSLATAMSFQFSLQTLVQIIFQGIGALAIVWMNYQFAWFGVINALMFLASAGFIMRYRHEIASNEPPVTTEQIADQQSLIKHSKETLSILTKNPFLLQVGLLALAVNTIGTSTDGLTNLTLLQIDTMWFGNYGNTVAILGMLLSIGMVLGALLTNDLFKRLSLFGLIACMMVLTSVIPVIMVLYHNAVILCVLFFSLGYLLGKINPKISAYLIEQTPENKLAMMSGVFSMIVMLGGPVGQAVLLGLANIYHPVVSWRVYLVASICVMVLSLYFNYKNHQKLGVIEQEA
ncbi:MFS transporter [Vagococcus penaei]|uniref:Major facilitator superfamily (MFS) profile domain-containing protein n=1 Tax=Vagococcus penaei TaxID=633807 RepID=A0A1Q2D5E1_9ENTE|nr:MFS transporter [Vagococcus penaei]AQP53616.1 hypothetical protein BW732_04790 [Vagococcus penaei]